MTYIATYRLNRPRGRCSENNILSLHYGIAYLFSRFASLLVLCQLNKPGEKTLVLDRSGQFILTVLKWTAFHLFLFLNKKTSYKVLTSAFLFQSWSSICQHISEKTQPRLPEKKEIKIICFFIALALEH